jgi:hypothetical protein
MSEKSPVPWRVRIEEYLDGQLSPRDRAAFDAAMAQDAALSAEVALQRRIDAALARRFEHKGEGPRKLTLKPQKTVEAARRRWVLPAWIGLAAAVAVAAITYWSTSRPDPLLRSPQFVYDVLQSRGFKPEWTCKDDQEFAAAVNERLGEPLLVPMSTPGVKLVGWAYADNYAGYALSEKGMVLITKVADDHVLVLMDRKRKDRELSVPPESGLHLFRREVGDLVLYEITPRKKPAVLEAARISG